MSEETEYITERKRNDDGGATKSLVSETNYKILIIILISIVTMRSYGVFTNDIGISFVKISPVMVDPSNKSKSDLHHGLNTNDLKNIKPFWIGTTEVTQAQWKSVMGTNPSYHKGGRLPVEMVSWDSAVVFCKKLGARDGLHYRLPTEAEWCYACDEGKKLKTGDLQGVAWTLENARH